MWFIYAIISFCCWGLADLFYKKSSDANDKQSHLKIAVWVGLVMGVCALILLPFAESGRSFYIFPISSSMHRPLFPISFPW